MMSQFVFWKRVETIRNDQLTNIYFNKIMNMAHKKLYF